MRAWRCGVAVIALVALYGCATPRTPPDERTVAWSELRERLEALPQWHAEGRIAVRGTGDPGTVNFTWTESPGPGFRLRLEGPWGQNVGRLEVGAERAVLTTRRGLRYVGRDPARLVERLYGWQIPVAALRHWLVGLPGDSSDYRLDRFGRLARLDWQGWRIEYRRHRVVDGLDLPADLRARHGGDGTEIRVAIDRWQLDGGEREPVDESPVPLMGG
mgnify:CR=1 FL=1